MSEKTLSRRALLRRGVALGAGVVGLTVIGCGGEEALSCTDTSGLEPAEQATRSALGYVEQSPQGAARNCANCNFFEAASANQCGGCTLIAGPINPVGYCNSWAEAQS